MLDKDWLQGAREVMADAMRVHHLDVRDMNRCVCGEWSEVGDDTSDSWDDHMAKVALQSLFESGLMHMSIEGHIVEWAIRRPDGRIIDASYDESHARESWADFGGPSSNYVLVRREMPPWQVTE